MDYRIVVQLLLIVFLLFTFYYAMRRTIYRAIFSSSPHLVRDPSFYDIHFEEVFFASADGVKLHGWYLPHDKPLATLLYFHGNLGNIASCVDELYILHHQIEADIFIFDYRGYGKSKGRPSERGLYKDALAAYDYLISQKQVAAEQLVGFGRSLGSAVAIYLASQKPLGALVVVSSFSSVRDLVKILFPKWLGWFINLCTPLRLASIDRVARVSCPILLLHGANDTMVPAQVGKKLYDAISSAKMWYNVPGASHNDTFIRGGKKYWYLLKAFIWKTIAAKPLPPNHFDRDPDKIPPD